MVSPINRVAHHGTKAHEVKEAAPKTQVVKVEAKKTEAVAQKPAALFREEQEKKVEEAKESSEALRTLAAREPNSLPAGPRNNTVSADAVIAAYKK